MSHDRMGVYAAGPGEIPEVSSHARQKLPNPNRKVLNRLPYRQTITNQIPSSTAEALASTSNARSSTMTTQQQQVAIVPTSHFDASQLTFGEPETIKLNKASMLKIPIKYGGKDLVLQTPVFKRCSIREFPKKADGDKNAIVMYQSIKYEDEQEYAQKVIAGLSEAVKQHMSKNVRALFNRKKDSMQNLTFNAHIQEPNDYDASIKTSVPTLSRDSLCPAKTITFYRGLNEEMNWSEVRDILEENNRSLSARCLIQVPYAYVLNRQQYGFKTQLSTMDITDKPEDAIPLDREADKENKDPAASAGSSGFKAALGNAFI